MKQYLTLLQDILENGDQRMERTGKGTIAVFGRQMRFQMSGGFPAMTTKRLAFSQVVSELAWMFAGDNDVRHLNQLGNHIWDGNAYADYWKPRSYFEGDAGRNYGVQWRHWRRPDGSELDQLAEVIVRIKTSPYDRRLIFTGWNAGEVELTCLPACHAFAQFFVKQGALSVAMYQRSCDTFLGVPFNIAQYSLILHLVAQMTGLKPGEFVHFLGDTHLYLDHLDQAREQITRQPYPLPTLWLNPELQSLDDFVAKYHEILERATKGEKPSDLTKEIARLDGYQSHGKIAAEMAV